MIDIELKIKKILIEKNFSAKDLVYKIGMTENGFAYALKNKTIKLTTLEKIAESLNIPISYFFEDESVSKKIIQNGNHNNIGTANSNNKTNTENEILLLQKEIEGLRKEIELLREINELLKKGK